MSRLILLIAIAAVVYLLLKSYRKNVPRQDTKVAEDMVRCVQCGLHLPKGESFKVDGNFFCCPEHRDAYRK
jgi:uncharacterized protein